MLHLSISRGTSASCTEEIEETEEIKELEETDVVREEVWRELNAAIEACILPFPNTSNRILFQLARRVRAIEKRHHSRLAPVLLRKVFNGWEAGNQTFLRPVNDYYCEFLGKLQAVRQPWGENLKSALESAYLEPPSVRVQTIRDPDAHVLASLCRELQRRAGTEPFYLIGRACAELLGRPHSTVAMWLRAFRTLG